MTSLYDHAGSHQDVSHIYLLEKYPNLNLGDIQCICLYQMNAIVLLSLSFYSLLSCTVQDLLLRVRSVVCRAFYLVMYKRQHLLPGLDLWYAELAAVDAFYQLLTAILTNCLLKYLTQLLPYLFLILATMKQAFLTDPVQPELLYIQPRH